MAPPTPWTHRRWFAPVWHGALDGRQPVSYLAPIWWRDTPRLSAVDDQDARAVVGLYWDGLWRRRDLTVVDELIGEPYVRHSSAGTRSLTRAQFKRELQQAWQLLHDPATTVEDQVSDGDKVWTRATTQGVNLDTGETSVVTWLVVHRLAGGRVVEAWIASLPGVDWRP
jgi:ketosteroid isomerase-like protein